LASAAEQRPAISEKACLRPSHVPISKAFSNSFSLIGYPQKTKNRRSSGGLKINSFKTSVKKRKPPDPGGFPFQHVPTPAW
jgi:hypothetical protein